MRDKKEDNFRFAFLYTVFLFIALVIILRLFNLQILNYRHYQALASGQYEVFKELFPERGNIYVSDNGLMTPIALNRRLGLLYAQPNHIENPEDVLKKIIPILKIEDNTDYQEILLKRLSKKNDPYEVLARRLDEDTIKKIKDLNIKGLNITYQKARYYPEKNLFCHITGFVTYKDDNDIYGQYGLEAYFDELLRGKQGYLDSERDALGRWIVIAKRNYKKAENGKDLKISLNPAIQMKVRSILKEAVELYEAEKGSVIVADPQTGAILAMVNYPDYDPNEYYKVENYSVFNNTAISSVYEPGSIFKVITMSAGIDANVVSPNTTYEDKGFIEYDDGYRKFIINNADKKAHGIQTMTNVLEKSLNTGTIFVMQKLGAQKFKDYVEKFGFGELTGIELMGEKSGNISSLEKSLRSKGEVYAATASYGQGITVTPLQMVMAVSAIANGGKLMKPYLIEDIISQDKTEHFSPKVIRQVISPETAKLVTAMMVSVIDNGHGKLAHIDGYYLAGKTGTAQIAKKGVYTKETIHSFIGFGPVPENKFIILVRLDKPQKGNYSSQTAAPTFHRIARYLLDYYHIAPSY